MGMIMQQQFVTGVRYQVRRIDRRQRIVAVFALRRDVPIVRRLHDAERWPYGTVLVRVHLVLALLEQHTVRHGNAILLQPVQRQTIG